MAAVGIGLGQLPAAIVVGFRATCCALVRHWLQNLEGKIFDRRMLKFNSKKLEASLQETRSMTTYLDSTL